MKNKIVLIGLFLLGGFSLFGQGNDLNASFPFGGVFVFCDEPVQIDGTYHIIYDFNFIGDGRVHGRYHINAKGRGLGLVSGAKYEWNDAINDTYNAAIGYTETFTQNFKVIGQGSATDFMVKQKFHITINPNGVLTVIKGDFEVVCN